MLELVKGSPLAAFLMALVVTMLATPIVKILAARAGALAKPDARRLHPHPIAQWGGLAVFLGVLAAGLLWRQPTPEDVRLLAPSGSASDIQETAQTLHLSTTFFGCGLLMLILGMADDKWELKPFWKFGGQILIVYLLWRGGVKINTSPFTEGKHALSDAASLFFADPLRQQ